MHLKEKNMHMIDKHMARHGTHTLAIGPASKSGQHSYSLYCIDCRTKKESRPLFLDWLSEQDARTLDNLGLQLLGEFNVPA
jgi:hypothetical protein